MKIPSDDTQSSYSLNANFWIKVVREKLDIYQVELLDPILDDLIGDITGFHVLDAGCGEGYLSRKLCTRKVAKIIGVDISSELIQSAVLLAQQEKLPVEYEPSDVSNLRFADNSFDLVIANRLPHAAKNPEKRFTEFSRVLKPRGRLILITHHPVFYSAGTLLKNGSKTLPEAHEYFTMRTISKPIQVSNITAPYYSEIHLYSLEQHFAMLTDNNFAITNLQEPHPNSQQILEQDKWKNFHPIFLILDCVNMK